MNRNTILVGDVLDKLKEIPDELIDCIITSPPYHGLRDYGTATWDGGDKNCNHRIDRFGNRRITEKTKINQANQKSLAGEFIPSSAFCPKCGAKRIDKQIGLEPTLEEYLDKLLAVTSELRRVLKPTGTMFWNHGDSYGTGSGSGVRRGKQATNRGTQTNVGWQESGKSAIMGYEKSLLLQNFRLVQRMCDEQKWILRNVIIWYKRNSMPSSVTDRFGVDYEPVFFFSKNKKYYFEQQLEPYTVPLNRWGGDKFNLRVRDTGLGKIKSSQYRASEEEIENYKNYQGVVRDNREMRPSKLGRNKRCVWDVPTSPMPEAHFATFPEALIKPMIKAGCPEFICKKCKKARIKNYKVNYVKNRPSAGNDLRSKNKDRLAHARGHGGWRGNNLLAQRESVGYSDCGCCAGWSSGVVLDPFFGSGTTGVVANKLRRDWIGIELSEKYVEIAKRRIAENPRPMI